MSGGAGGQSVETGQPITATVTLEYHFWDGQPDPGHVTPEHGSPNLYSVYKVSASIIGGTFRVTLEGALLKRDGTKGRHNRCCAVDLEANQPVWLEDLIHDASDRLGTSAKVSFRPEQTAS